MKNCLFYQFFCLLSSYTKIQYNHGKLLYEFYLPEFVLSLYHLQYLSSILLCAFSLLCCSF